MRSKIAENAVFRDELAVSNPDMFFYIGIWVSIYDVESGILTGEIVERQKDKATAEWKYRITGKQLMAVKLRFC